MKTPPDRGDWGFGREDASPSARVPTREAGEVLLRAPIWGRGDSLPSPALSLSLLWGLPFPHREVGLE